MSSSKEMCAARLSEVIRWSNMSANAFALHIGLKHSENLYQILRGNNGISKRLADTIVSSFPQIDMLWLREGKGDMIVKDRQQIDLYDIDAEGNIASIAELQPSSSVVLPIGEECDFAMIYNGMAMGDTIPSGSMVMLKRVERESIIPGKEYLLVSGKIATLRVVRAPVVNDPLRPMWRLVAVESERFDDIVVSVDAIDAVYRVVAKLIINY